jgi:hypothetical protein
MVGLRDVLHRFGKLLSLNAENLHGKHVTAFGRATFQSDYDTGWCRSAKGIPGRSPRAVLSTNGRIVTDQG